MYIINENALLMDYRDYTDFEYNYKGKTHLNSDG